MSNAKFINYAHRHSFKITTSGAQVNVLLHAKYHPENIYTGASHAQRTVRILHRKGFLDIGTELNNPTISLTVEGEALIKLVEMADFSI